MNVHETVPTENLTSNSNSDLPGVKCSPFYVSLFLMIHMCITMHLLAVYANLHLYYAFFNLNSLSHGSMLK